MDDLTLAIIWAMDNPGDVREYARGYLPGRANAPVSKEMSEAAARARYLFCSGLVELVQRRLGDFLYSYLMIARSEPAGGRVHFWLEKPTRKYEWKKDAKQVKIAS